jgi:voltage-gated potassium channel
MTSPFPNKRSVKRILYQQLDTEYAQKIRLSPTNWALLFLILCSLALYTAETELESQSGQTGAFWLVNLVILLIFGIEFVLRLWIAGIDARFKGLNGLLTYIRCNWFMVLVDFVAFAPELLFLLIGLSPPSLFRSFRVFRLFKMTRYFPAFKLVLEALRACYNELLAALALSTVLWYLASVALYLAEGQTQPEDFGSITRSMWWSVVTLTTVGYGDVYPVTVLGKLAAGAVAVVGLGAVALPSGILAGAFIDSSVRGRRTRPL